MKVKDWFKKTDIDIEFEKNEAEFMTTLYRDGEPLVLMMNNTRVMAFNIWASLTKAEPLFDEVRIRLATEEETKEWAGLPFE